MFNFFVILYYSIFQGSWNSWLFQNGGLIKSATNNSVKNVAIWIMNALGGQFSTIESFDLYNSFPPEIVSQGTQTWFFLAIILSIVTMIGVVFAVWKIIRSLFFIFFEGWR